MIVPVVRDVKLPALSAGDKVPTVSLHVLAKNAENVIGRLLDNVGPYVQEIRIILNDTTDFSRKVIESKMARWPTTSFDIQEVTFESHPALYIQDEMVTYQQGASLAGEVFDGPFTGKPLLANWAGIRNMGWSSSCEWRLFLDADDVVEDPDKLPALVKLLDGNHVDMAATKYVFGRNDAGAANSVTYRERLTRNTPNIRWEGCTHEILTGSARAVLVEDCFRVVDLKDNWGRGVRVPGRCFKVLYQAARMADWKVTARHLAYLIQESVDMLPLAFIRSDLLRAYLERMENSEEGAWVLCLVGEMFEAKEEFAEAERLFMQALGHYHSSKAAFRLCRARFMQKNWVGSIVACEQGIAYQSQVQILDQGPVYEHASKLLAAHAHFELGHKEEAKRLVDEAVEAFGATVSSAVLELRDAIHVG